MIRKLLFLSTIITLTANAQTAGPNNPASVTNTMCTFAYSSTVGYTPAGNVSASDNLYATAVHCNCCDQNTQCLTAADFGFSIPAGAVINGIVLEVEKKRSAGGSGIVEDNGLQIMKGGLLVGPNKSQYGVDWPTTDTYVSYGSPSDLWGTTWTAAEINATDFGVSLASISYVCGATITTSIDHVRMTVHFTSTTGTHEIASANGTVLAYPVPVTSGGTILFGTLTKLETFVVIDALGKEVFRSTSETNKINLPDLKSGIYFVTITNTDGKHTCKISVE